MQEKGIDMMKILLANKGKCHPSNSKFAIHTSQRSNQKLQKNMSCQRTKEIKLVANLKMETKKMDKSQPLINSLHSA